MEVGDIYNPYKMHVGSHIPNAILRLRELSFGAKLVFARLGQYAGEDGRCFPKQETLANELGSSLTAIKRFLNELVDKQFIVKETPKGQDRYMHKTIRYFFCWHECFEENFSPQSETDLSPKRTSPQSEIGLSAQSETDLSNLRESKKEKKRKRIKERAPKSKTSFSTNQDKSPSPPIGGTPPPKVSGSENQPSKSDISESLNPSINSNIHKKSETPLKHQINPLKTGNSQIPQTTILNPTNNNREIRLVELLYRERTEKFPDIPFSDGEKQRWVAVMNNTLKEGYKPDVLSDAIKFIFNWGDSYWRKRIMKPRNFRENILSVVTQMTEDEQQKKKDEEKEKFFID